jgi:Protein of unknown function (DUF1706)
MNKAELIRAMQSARAEWESVLALTSEDRMTLPVLHGGWSVKDTIGHVAYYERWLQDWLEAAVRGQVTVASHRDLLGVDARNAIIWGENKDRPLSEILDESRYVFDRLFQIVKLLPEADLLAPYAYDRYVLPFWDESMALWECIADDSYDHYREHTANIRRWLDAHTAMSEIAERRPN